MLTKHFLYIYNVVSTCMVSLSVALKGYKIYEIFFFTMHTYLFKIFIQHIRDAQNLCCTTKKVSGLKNKYTLCMI